MQTHLNGTLVTETLQHNKILVTHTTMSDGGQFTVAFTAKNTDGTYDGNIAAGAKGQQTVLQEQII